MSGYSKAVLAFGLVAAFSTPAWAQGRGGGMGMGGRVGAPGLLTNASVQKELKLEADQVEKAKGVAEELQAKMRETMGSLQDLDPADRMKKMAEVAATTTEEALKASATFLKPEQSKRFKEIVLQQAGPQALAYPMVAKKLNVTNEQAGKVAALIAEAQTSRMEAMKSAAGDRAAMTAATDKIRKATGEKALALMTESQQKEWKDMLGEPFEVKFEAGPGGPGGARTKGTN